MYRRALAPIVKCVQGTSQVSRSPLLRVSTVNHQRHYSWLNKNKTTEAAHESDEAKKHDVPAPTAPESMTPAEIEALKSSVDELTASVAKLEETNADTTDKYKRALAETENVRRRGNRLVSEAKLFSVQSFVKDIAEVADILDKALEMTPEAELAANEPLKTLHDGVHMTRTNLLTVFKKHGVVKVDDVKGKPFDPNLYEAVAQVPTTDEYPEANVIADIVAVGYSLHDRPIRAAKVVVTKK